MPDGDPRPNDPLSPYYPSEVPDVPGDGRTWVALLLAATLLLGAAWGLVTLVLSL
ncbi:MAG: hypothetical protein ABEI80_10625 [Haloplanus sp.]